MPFPVALTTQQKIDLRSSEYKHKLFVIATPKSIVFQATVKDAISDSDYAEIEYDTPTTGAFGDIKPGMTVLVHESSVDIDDVRFPPTYARRAATSTVVKIGHQAVDLLGTDTITVLDDYRLHSRQVRIVESSQFVYLDYDKTWSALPPAIHGLQSVYVVDSSSAASLSFAPTVEAMASGAAISTYLWGVGDGTITTGTSTSKDITVSFPAWSNGATDGWRWVSLTATDDNSNATTFNFQVFVGDLDSAAWVISDAARVDIGMDADGAIGSLSLGDSASTLYDDQHITVVVRETKNSDSDPIVSNIAFVGRLKGLVDNVTASIIEATSSTEIVYDTSYEMQGYAVDLSLLALPEYQLLFSDAASDWNQVTDLSVARAIWYVLANLTTATTVMSFDLDTATWNDYQSSGFAFEEGTVLESVQAVVNLAGATLAFARSGEVELLRDARLLSESDRDTLATILDATNLDFTRRIKVNIPPTPRIGRIQATAATFNTSAKKSSILRATAPRIPNTLGEREQQIDFLLASDPATTSDTLTELSVLTANTLAMQNEPIQIDVGLKKPYWFLMPYGGAWFTVSYSDFQSGVTYDASTRWILESASLSVEIFSDQDTRQQWRVDATFSIETFDQGVANLIMWAPNVQPYAVPQMSFQAPYGSNYTPENAYANKDAINENQDTAPNESNSPISPPDEKPRPSPTKDVINVPLSGSVISMNKTTVNGNVYKVTVSGHGVTDLNIVETLLFDVRNPALVQGTVDLTPGGDYLATTGFVAHWTAEDIGADAEYTYDLPRASEINVQKSIGVEARLQLTGINLTWREPVNSETTLQSSYSYDAKADGGIITLEFFHTDILPDPPNFPSSLADFVVREYTHTDAFFDFDSSGETAHGATKGLQVNGSDQSFNVVSPPYYNPAHTYTFYMTGTGAKETFSYLDTDYTDNDGALRVVIEGEFA